jgi:TolA-binding protein
VQVTERGAPEADVDLILPVATSAPEAPAPLPTGAFRAAPAAEVAPTVPLTAPAAPAGNATVAARASDPPAAEGLDPFDQALELYQDGKYVEAQRRFERLSRAGGRRAAEAALYAAQSVRSSAGCAPAVRHFERVRLEFPGSPSAYEAAWRAARCLQQTGDVAGARRNYESLLQVSSHAERARAALAALGGPAPKTTSTTLGSPAGKAAAAAPNAQRTPPRRARPASTAER